MSERVRHLAPLAGVVLFAAALVALHHALRDVRYRDVVQALRALPRPAVLLALGTTALGYLSLTCYDTLACRYVGRPLPYRQTAFASFVGYAFSHTLGIPWLSGGAIRLRLYSAWGFSATEVGAIVAFNSLTFWLGFASMGGLVLVLDPPHVPASFGLSVHALRVLGTVLLLVALAYVLLTVLRRTPITIRGRELPLPSPRIVGPQLAVAAVDWMCASLTLWALLPPTDRLSVPSVLGAYILAQTVGIVSHVPGGLGVFETAVVLLVSPPLDAQAVLGSLIAFRAIYYLLPLVLAALALGVHELRLHRALLQRVARVGSDWAAAVVPQVLAAAAFASGAVLLVSSALPETPRRLAQLASIVPLPVIEASHVLAALVGVGLVVVARDLQRRLETAYLATASLLAAGIALSLLKGLAYEEAFILGVTLLAFLPCRTDFYRRAPLLGDRLTPGWTAAVALVIGASAWLVVFAHRHVVYADEPWLQFPLRPGAPRALRATAAAVAAAVVLGAWTLRRQRRPDPGPPDVAALARAEAVAAATPTTRAYLALAGDKRLLFSDDERAFLMYGVERRTWVALGDPVGSDDQAAELAWRFRELADRHKALCAFLDVPASSLPLYHDLGLVHAALGEQGRVRLAEFSLDDQAREAVRRTVGPLLDAGWSVRVAARDEVAARMHELRAIADAWRTATHAPERGFVAGSASPEYLRRFPAAVVEREGELVAFGNVWCGAGREELALDLVRWRPAAPPDVMAFLFAELMRWGRAQGYAWFDLGTAPLARPPEPALAPLWNRAGLLLFRHGEHFRDAQSLRAFDEQLGAVWTPRHVALPGGPALARALIDVGTLTASGPSGASPSGLQPREDLEDAGGRRDVARMTRPL